MNEIQGTHIHITGIVQGVGFRPFVYGLAARFALKGWVRNTSGGVEIEVDGTDEALQAFTQALQRETPPLARIDEFHVVPRQPNGFSTFEIIHSEAISGAFQPISPDVSLCPDCLRELFDPGDRRYRYPFINCTNCGPRFTIIQDIPYDRPKTTMAGFEMCPDCAREYSDPLDRRFHAQPVACPVCGPKVWLEFSDPSSVTSVPKERRDLLSSTDSISWVREEDLRGEAAIDSTQRLLAEGRIVAIKGLGGFHLACDATNAGAVRELRQRKLRVDKPFALMMPDIETVEAHCLINEAERELLVSRERPIVLLQRRPASPVVPEVAPGQNTLGVMLPYTPLHYLLLAGQSRPETDEGRTTTDGAHPSSAFLYPPPVLVMTSGNLSEEPIAIDNEEARQRLACLADAFLMHDRPIYMRCDDSVARIFSSPQIRPLPLILRRSRGFAPFPVRLPWEAPPLLAAGAELKNTFCLARNRYAFLSHHIGDLENYETLQSFEQGVAHFERLFRILPEAFVYDLHPNYLATRYAVERAENEGLPAIGVQHHHAHIAACMSEHGLTGDQPVIGVSFDGTGYGEDGAIWGGEFLLADYQGFRRAAHLAYLPLPGGDAAVRKPARTALAYLWQAGLEWEPGLPSVKAFCAEERQALRAQLEHGLNTPLTSSMGRLFDAVAALVGVRQTVNYEAQAAIELEALADPDENGTYAFEIDHEGQGEKSLPGDLSLQINPVPVLKSATSDFFAGVPVGKISSRFHNSVSIMVLDVCRAIRTDIGIDQVALSGGVWQNMILLMKTLNLLEKEGFRVYIHSQIPANDGGISLGQAAVAINRLRG